MHGFFTLRILFLDRFIRLAMPGFFIFRILSQTFDYHDRWVSRAAWLSARYLSLAVSSVGDPTAPGVSYLKIYLQSYLDLPLEVDPDRIYQKGESHVDSNSPDLAFLLLFC